MFSAFLVSFFSSNHRKKLIENPLENQFSNVWLREYQHFFSVDRETNWRISFLNLRGTRLIWREESDFYQRSRNLILSSKIGNFRISAILLLSLPDPRIFPYETFQRFKISKLRDGMILFLKTCIKKRKGSSIHQRTSFNDNLYFSSVVVVVRCKPQGNRSFLLPKKNKVFIVSFRNLFKRQLKQTCFFFFSFTTIWTLMSDCPAFCPNKNKKDEHWKVWKLKQ